MASAAAAPRSARDSFRSERRTVKANSGGNPLIQKRRPPLTIVLSVATTALIVLIAVLMVLFTGPLGTADRTSVQWSGWQSRTGTIGPPFETAYFFTGPLALGPAFCHPPNSVGNITVSFVWQSSVANTTARFFWNVGSNLAPRWVYYVNNSAQGGYTFPPTLLSFLCTSRNVVDFQWFTPTQNAEITLSGVSVYNYTASQPIW